MTHIPRIIEHINALNQDRISQLKDIFSPISFVKKKLEISSRNISGGIIFGISDKLETNMEYARWRFRIKEEGVNAMYNEKWSSLDKGKYFLESANFHIYINSSEGEQEKKYVFLQCDASEPDGHPNSVYKKNVHLHVKCAEYPIDKAHISLFNDRADEVLSSIKNFHSALKSSITMLQIEILNNL